MKLKGELPSQTHGLSIGIGSAGLWFNIVVLKINHSGTTRGGHRPSINNTLLFKQDLEYRVTGAWAEFGVWDFPRYSSRSSLELWIAPTLTPPANTACPGSVWVGGQGLLLVAASFVRMRLKSLRLDFAACLSACTRHDSEFAFLSTPQT